ncbi:hypothetical protein [Kitasatospora kifunensis]|uniref:Uncharacterized protein n=1 Tax=Kitasatospora kifunensis TaxID=58351 RepID=A0A7W7RBU2_KITKI|nr:hypothetical protein [Kitasatospora kifunensis]MBB4928808.1 hypothetical protein [Kitasatospora kifunensis]
MLARDLSPTAKPPLRQVLRSTATLLRRMRRHRLWRSPAHPPTHRRHTVWTQAPTAWPRAAARAGGASTNDVFLTALAAAIAEWAGTSWPGAADVAIPVMVPVSLRTPEEVGVPGNRLFLTRIDLPGGTMPAGERLERTRVVTADLKSADHKAVLRLALTDVEPARTEPTTASDTTSLLRALVTSLVQRSTTAAVRRK